MFVECLAEDVEYLAAVCLPLFLDLGQRRTKTSPSRVLLATRFQSRQTSLADAVNSPEALFDAIWIPRQVVIHHQVCSLKVESLARRIGRQKDLAVAVLRELLGDRAPFFAADTAVNGLHGAWPADQRADPRGEVVQGVAVLGEDDELARPAVGISRECFVLENPAELGPLSVGA